MEIDTETPPPAGPRVTFSQCQRFARAVLGPWARVWAREGEPVRIGVQTPTGPRVLVEADTYADAIRACFVREGA